jgi:hypothetical protein
MGGTSPLERFPPAPPPSGRTAVPRPRGPHPGSRSAGGQGTLATPAPGPRSAGEQRTLATVDGDRYVLAFLPYNTRDARSPGCRVVAAERQGR